MGRVVNGYELFAELGRGSYGSVYRARRNGVWYAVKEQKPREAGVLPASILREASIVLNARHPCVLRGYEVFCEQGLYYTVLACGATTLNQWLRECYANHEAPSIAFHILCALVFLHDAQIVHGDLKPANIILFPQSGLCVADFGLSKRGGGIGSIQSVWWRAPEVCGEQAHGIAADMWSFGIILYQLFTRTMLFTETDPVRLLQLQRTNPRPFRSEDTNLTELINGCLELDPLRRLTARQALASPLFSKWRAPEGYWLSTPLCRSLPYEHTARVRRHSTSDAAALFALDLLERLGSSERNEVIACSYLASLLVDGRYPEYSSPVLQAIIWQLALRLEWRFYR